MPMLDRWKEPFSSARQALELQPEHIEGFRRSQKLAYESALAAEKQLREGMTERRAAELIVEYLADHGVHEYFHTPFAWFGDRTAFTKFRSNLDFAPTTRRLEPGDAVILDVAPVVDGHAADIGYSCSFGENQIQEQLAEDLVAYRALILDGVKAGRKRSDIYRDVDRLIVTQGYENRHQRYPNRVLGHRVTWTPVEERSRRTFMGFGLQTLRVVVASNVMTQFSKGFQSPEWNDLPSSDHRAYPGLWAIEPHLGFRGTGAKWEEILVVTHDDAYWIDDDVPHLRRFQSKNASGPKEGRPN
jgi:Xaa-Pro aminopeptidase